MKYDFTSLMNRSGHDSIAVDIPPERKPDVQKREILHYRKQPGNILIFWTMMISFLRIM